MKILHVVAYYKPAYIYGGPVFSVGSLCERLSKSGHQVRVYTTLANGSEELNLEPGKMYDVDGVEVRYFRRRTYDLSHFSPTLLLELWKDARKYDIVHISGWWNTVSVLGALVCLLRGVQPVVSLRGMLGPYSFSNGRIVIKRILHVLLGQKLLSRSILHATVKQELREAEGVVKSASGFVLPNFLELPPYVEMEKCRSEHVRFIFLGRIHHKKNIEFLFNVLSELNCTWSLSILGSGDERYINTLMDLSGILGISKHVKWLGHIDGKEKYSALEAADIMVLLSHAENFANTVVESLSVGTAVFLSDRVGMAEYVADHDYGKVVSLNLEEAIVKLNELTANKDLLKRIFKEAPYNVRQDFSGERLLSKYVMEYEKRCGKRKD